MGLVKELEKTTTINYLDGIVHLNGLQRFVDDFLISNTGYSSDFFLQSDHKCHSEQPRIRESDKGILCLERINNVQFVNKYLERINKSLDNGEYCMIRLETKDSRRVRILKKFPRIISRPYYAMDFVLKRLFPKWGPTKRIYFWLTQGNNRVISLTEALGRLVSCGFEIVAHQRVGYDTFIIGKKVREPHYDMEASFGMLVYLNRIGLNGKSLRSTKSERCILTQNIYKSISLRKIIFSTEEKLRTIFGSQVMVKFSESSGLTNCL